MGKNLKQKYGDHAIGAHIAKVLPAGIASFITFLLVGIWHGANMKYVAFGVWNGSVILLSVLMQPYLIKQLPVCIFRLKKRHGVFFKYYGHFDRTDRIYV